jgi:gamma-glutamyltranspeptidase/glutathione hydrolase
MTRTAALLLVLAGCSHRAPDPAPEEPPRQAAIATYHPEATRAARELLSAGGNAFDAFVAATLVEYVLAPGVTSAAGPLVAMVFDAAHRQAWHLDGDLAAPLAAPRTQAGRALMIPGALAALSALHERFGRLPWRELVEPAHALAEAGFAIDDDYAGLIVWRQALLAASDYGRRTFFRDGQPLKAGDLLRQPELAGFLAAIAEEGAAHMYRGAWADGFAAAAQASGSGATAEDLRRYAAAWRAPYRFAYHGHQILTPAGRTVGGLWDVLALEVLDRAGLRLDRPYAESADLLEVLMRIARRVWSETWFFDVDTLDAPARVAARMSADAALSLWQDVRSGLSSPAAAQVAGHSYSISIVDAEGNAITGTHTITSLPWGDGVFVEGVPLTAGGALGLPATPGERWASTFATLLVTRGDRLRAALSTFSTSEVEAGFQLLIDVIDYGLAADEAVARPRFGSFPSNDTFTATDPTKNMIDRAIDPAILAQLVERGLQLDDGAWQDTGLGAVVTVDDAGRLAAGYAPRADLHGEAGVY